MDGSKGHIDWLIFLPVIALMVFSVAFVYSASAAIAASKFGSTENLFLKHLIRVCFGLIALIIFSKIDYHVWLKISKPLMIVSIILLIIVLFTGKVNQVNRWIDLGPFSFQPSELAKFALVIHFATLLSKKQEVIKDFKEGYFPFLLWLAAVCYLIAMQPNFSTAVVIYLISLALVFIGNANVLHILLTLVSTGIMGFLYLTSSTTYRLNRMVAYFNGNSDSFSQNVNYQLNQALIALGNGGTFGVGPGMSKQSHLFLPESYGDFIFSIIGEEYGFVGAVIILGAFIMIFWRGMIVAKKAPDIYGYYLAVGILITFAVYVFVNAGVNSGILPTTGLPMPFISYGGTAVIFYATAAGILLNISAQSGIFPISPSTAEFQQDE